MTIDFVALSPNVPNFSIAFQKMASVVAIAKTRNSADVCDELVKQCFVILPNDPLGTSAAVVAAIQTLFGIKLAEQDISRSIRRLTDKKQVVQLPGSQLGLPQEVRQALEARIAEARQLEQEVKHSWLSQSATTYPKLNKERLWQVLMDYLAQAFRRHGIQAVTLLDPTAEVAKEQLSSLSSVLSTSIRGKFIAPEDEDARKAVASFFATVGSDRRRAEYVAQLADGAFNYFSLTISPEVSEHLRGRLSPLILFLDTNFLFGILNLHVNPQVDVSTKLIEAVKKFGLPFRLRYHEATTREMNNSLVYFGSELRKRKWTQAISRAAVGSGQFSGIELRYHQMNATQPVDVADFLSPYEYWDVLLKDKDIDVYKITPSNERLKARADMEADYKEFLALSNREKPHEAVQHDMTVLETVRSLRTNAKSSLEAGALMVTCDNQLFRFDVQMTRRDHSNSCTVLPSLFWQILRPFVPDDIEFDQAFAETFALPEFSLSRGGAAKAASKMLGILASFSGIPEETAVKILANDMLLDGLQEKSEEEYLQAVESALVEENATLIEEKAAHAQQLAAEKELREASEQELSTATHIISEKDEAIAEQEKTLHEKDKALHSLQLENQKRDLAVREQVEQVLKERKEKEEAEKRTKDIFEQKEAVERKVQLLIKITSVIAALFIGSLFEIVIHIIFRWEWLLTHSQSYGLQGCIILMLFTGIVGLGVKSWRNVLWLTLFSGGAFVLLQLLGGPTGKQ